MTTPNPLHLHSFNQTLRFNNNATILKNYVCSVIKHNPLTEWTKHGKIADARALDPDYTDNYNYEPICPFPKINSGWMYHNSGDNLDFSNVKINDCNITWAESTGGRYEVKCRFYFIASILPMLFCIHHLHVMFLLKKEASKKNKKIKTKSILRLFSRNPNVNEQMCWLAVIVGFVHCWLCLDIDAWQNGNLTLKQLLMAWATASCIHIFVLLVQTWVTIIDGGKSKSTPPWCLWLSRFSFIAVYVFETVFGQLMRTTGKAADYDVYSNSWPTIAKNSMFLLVVGTWGSLAAVYGLKIAKHLKGNDGEVNPQYKKILKWCKTCVCFCFLGFWWKTFPLMSYAGRPQTYYGVPPCNVKSFAMINTGLLLVQYTVAWVQQPSIDGQRTGARLVAGIRSTVTGGSSKSRASTKKKNGSSNTGSSNTDSSNMYSSTASSTNTSSLKASSVVPEGESEIDSIVESQYDDIDVEAK